MHLPGRLSSSTLGDLLGSLHRARTTGQLELREVRGPAGRSVPGRVHRVHLHAGLVAAVDTGLSVPRLGEILRREGLAQGDVLRRLLASIEAGDRRAAGEILESAGLSVEAVRAGLSAQLKDRIEALFAIEEAVLRFHAARPLSQARRPQPLGPAEFLHGRPRARDRGRAKPPPPPREPPHDPPRLLADDAREHARRLLGIPRGAGLGDVRRAFRRLASVLHPDRLGCAPPDEQRRSAAQFAELSAAYHLLLV
jgi:hypothetical protein